MLEDILIDIVRIPELGLIVREFVVNVTGLFLDLIPEYCTMPLALEFEGVQPKIGISLLKDWPLAIIESI